MKRLFLLFCAALVVTLPATAGVQFRLGFPIASPAWGATYGPFWNTYYPGSETIQIKTPDVKFEWKRGRTYTANRPIWPQFEAMEKKLRSVPKAAQAKR